LAGNEQQQGFYFPQPQSLWMAGAPDDGCFRAYPTLTIEERGMQLCQPTVPDIFAIRLCRTCRNTMKNTVFLEATPLLNGRGFFLSRRTGLSAKLL
jgi:hypothetical protein